MIELLGVCYLKVLENISFKIQSGEIVTIIGPNGSGKTSLLKIIAGIRDPSSGKIVGLEKIKVGYMPQKIKFSSGLPMTVQDFLMLDRNIDADYLLQKIKRVLIEDLISRQIYTLSGGELQKVLFVAAMAGRPDILVLDEPVNNLDIAAREEFYKILEEEKKTCSIIMASHDIHVVMKKTEKVICINKKLCCMGYPESIVGEKGFIDLFGSSLSLYKHEH